MTRKEYTEYLELDTQEKNLGDLDCDELGYLVEYKENNQKQYPNDIRHSGYVSWVPKNVVDSTTEESTVPPYQQRVIDESNELDIRVQKLQDFISNPGENNPFFGLSAADQQTLTEQYQAMKLYANILHYRISRF